MYQHPRLISDAEAARDADERMRQFAAEGERRLREQEEKLRRGPIFAFDEREAFRLALDVALRRLRALPAAELTDAAINLAFAAGADEINRYIGQRQIWLASIYAGSGIGSGSNADVDEGRRCIERARNELRLELEAFRAERVREAQGHGGPTDGRLPGEITLAEASKEFDVPKPEWSRAAKRPPNDVRHLPHRRLGRNVFVQRVAAKRFAEDYAARREQRAVNSLRPEH